MARQRPGVSRHRQQQRRRALSSAAAGCGRHRGRAWASWSFCRRGGDQEVQITKDKTTRPPSYNDIVIDNLAVSGETPCCRWCRRRLHRGPQQHQRHLHQQQAIKKQLLTHNDDGRDRQVQDQVPGRRRRRLREDQDHAASATPFGLQHAAGSAAAARTNCGPSLAAAPDGQHRRHQVLNGAAAVARWPSRRWSTTVGKPGVQVASITKRPNGYASPTSKAPRPASTAHRWSVTPSPLKQRRRDRTGRHADAVHSPLSRSPRSAGHVAAGVRERCHAGCHRATLAQCSLDDCAIVGLRGVVRRPR